MNSKVRLHLLQLLYNPLGCTDGVVTVDVIANVLANVHVESHNHEVIIKYIVHDYCTHRCSIRR